MNIFNKIIFSVVSIVITSLLLIGFATIGFAVIGVAVSILLAFWIVNFFQNKRSGALNTYREA